MSKKIIFVLIILVAGFLAFLYYRGTFFSKEILKLEILGPDSVKAGEEVQYTVKYKNNGNFVLQDPKLIFELPDNSLTEDSKTRIEQNLKDIYPGNEEIIQFWGRPLGKEGDLKVAKAALSYIPKNITARYESNTTFTTKIDTVPITLEFDLPSKAEKGKEIAYSLNYFSNIDYPLENLSIKIDSINGFSFQSSDPSSLDKSEWKLQTLNKAQGGRINVKGTITADTGSHLTFGATLGMRQDGGFVELKKVNADLEVIEPLLFISQQINGASNYVASPGEKLHYEIFLRNIGTSPFDNLFVMSRIDGSALDLSTLQSEDGQARPNDNLIVWDSKQVSGLAHLSPQQETKVDFYVTLKSSWTPSDADKNSLLLKNRVNVSDISQEFDTKVNTKLEILQKVDMDSPGNYTIAWQVKNYFNDAKNVKVRLVLPQGAVLTGQISPENQSSNFSMDNTSREVIWSVGSLAAGTGVTNSGPQLSFQVSSLPGASIGPATVLGEDQSTGASVRGNAIVQ